MIPYAKTCRSSPLRSKTRQENYAITQCVKKRIFDDFRRILAEKNAIKSTSQLARRQASASFSPHPENVISHSLQSNKRPGKVHRFLCNFHSFQNYNENT